MDTPPHLWRSAALGDVDEVLLPQGRLQYFRRGHGPVIVFAHGWLANANLWRNVIDRLADRFTCVALDLPLGAHRLAMNPDADLSPAVMIEDAYSFTPEDQPDRLAEEIAKFVEASGKA